jgi:hypothetical protein
MEGRLQLLGEIWTPRSRCAFLFRKLRNGMSCYFSVGGVKNTSNPSLTIRP